ncbi:MAG: DMT family transporter [Pseudomonadota bacterium]
MSSLLLTVALSLAAASLFSLGNHCSKRALNYADSQTVTLYQMGIATALYWLTAPLYMRLDYWLSAALPIIAAIGLFRPLLSANLGTAGTRILGPTVSSTMGATGPLVGVTLGVLWLGETLTWQGALGTFGIAAAVVVLSWRGSAARHWPLWALLLPIGATLVRSVSHAISKIGMESIPSPFFVALVTYSVSFPLALLWDRLRGERVVHRSLPLRGVLWMFGSGTLYAIAVASLNTALLSGDLVVVSPIVACGPLITLMLGVWVFNEAHLDRRTVVAVSLVVPSVALIGIAR